MNKGVSTVVFPVSDLAKAKSVFTRLLGVEPIYDDPYYVGYSLSGEEGGVPILGLDPNGHSRGMTGATPFWEVDDIEGAVAGLVEAGATIIEDVHGVGGGGFVAILADADGNMIGLTKYQRSRLVSRRNGAACLRPRHLGTPTRRPHRRRCV